MRHPYLDRAFSLLVLCATLGCGGDDKSDPKTDDGSKGDDTGAPAKPIKEVPFDKLTKSKKLKDLTPEETKGFCLGTLDDLISITTGMCQEGATTGLYGDECQGAFDGCEDALSPEGEATKKQLCDVLLTVPDDCPFTVAEYVDCQKDLGKYYDGLRCDQEDAPKIPDCAESYYVCQWGF